MNIQQLQDCAAVLGEMASNFEALPTDQVNALMAANYCLTAKAYVLMLLKNATPPPNGSNVVPLRAAWATRTALRACTATVDRPLSGQNTGDTGDKPRPPNENGKKRTGDKPGTKRGQTGDKVIE